MRDVFIWQIEKKTFRQQLYPASLDYAVIVKENGNNLDTPLSECL